MYRIFDPNSELFKCFSCGNQIGLVHNSCNNCDVSFLATYMDMNDVPKDDNFKSESNEYNENKDSKDSKDVFESEQIRYGKILDLKGKINKSDIRKAYKQKMKEYHPDKISNMAEELQELALKRTKEINEAYEYFKKKYGE